MTVKTVFIAHQISGDVEANIKEVIEICKSIHTDRVLPIFPSFTWRQYLSEEVRAKHLADLVNEEYFKRGMVDEVWLYGPKISAGMIKEIDLAISYNIPVIAKDTRLKHALELILNPKI